MMRIRPLLTMMLGVVAVAALAVRVPSIAEPLGIDQSLWASAVRGMSRHQLYGVGATDVVSLTGAAAVLAVAAVIAGWLPARRAAAVDPVVALRES